MITFLQFVCLHFLGRPARDRGRGEWYWDCPKCGGTGFHTRPILEGCKDKFSCWSCGWWGDEYDFLRQMNAEPDYDKLLGDWVVQKTSLASRRGEPKPSRQTKKRSC